MPTQNDVSVTRSSLNLRIKPEDKILIDRAANAVGKTVPSLFWKLLDVQLKKRWQICESLTSVPKFTRNLLASLIQRLRAMRHYEKQ